MQKNAPSPARILVAIGFTLSCFGLLLFLWLAFGGPVPLKSKSYRVTAYFAEGVQLAGESDVRIGGVSVGKVKALELAPPDIRTANGQDMTAAEIEIKPEFAPISSNASAILRQKTLLGETYVELTSGTEPGESNVVALGAAANLTDAQAAEAAEPIPEDGTLGVGQTQDQTQIDEIFNALDTETRQAFQEWQIASGIAIQGRGLDLNDAFGNLGPFLADGADVLGALQRQKQSLKGLVRDTGEVFEALTRNESALAGAIVNSEATFGAIASEKDALAEVIAILPTFQRETQATFTRLDQFQADTQPLIDNLQPVAKDISPTLRSVRQLSPNLKSLFGDLDSLVDASEDGLPALRQFLGDLRPVLAQLDPFLANLNPVIRYLKAYRHNLTDFLAGPPAALAGLLPDIAGVEEPAPRHILRQISYLSPETLSVHPNRLDTNRGNGYLKALDITNRRAVAAGIFPNFDCDNTDGERTPGDGGSPTVSDAFAACIIADDFGTRFGGGQNPQVTEDP